MLLLIASGCGSSKASTSSTSAPSSTTGASGNTITAALTEYHIALTRTTLAAGTYTFEAVNDGHIVHALEITGPGVGGVRTSDLQPGQSAALTVTLRTGSYDVFCPIPGHKALGMNTEVTVQAAGSSAGGTPAASVGSSTSSPASGSPSSASGQSSGY